MAELLTHHRIYDITSIGRPLDPSWPSNKAVLILLPLAACIGLAWGLWGGADILRSLGSSWTFAVSLFACWALARELMPDDQVSAFVSMALGFLVVFGFDQPGLLIVFATLGLVRIVNRSTGLAARLSDSALVTLLVVFTVYENQSPWFGAVAGLAFFLDGVLYKPNKKQWWFALVCLGSMVVYIVDHDVVWWEFIVPGSLLQWLTILSLLIFSLHLLLLRKVHSKGDIDNLRLDLQRVKAGMSIGVLATLQGLRDMTEIVLMLATIGGLCLGFAFRRAFRSPVKGLRAG